MRSKRSSGFISIELMIALVVIAIATAGGISVLMSYLDGLDEQHAAQQQQQVAKAAEKYLKDNFSTVLASAGATAPAVITVPMLRNTRYLPAGFRDTNIYGQQYQVLARKPAANQLETLIVTTGGQVASELSIRRIAQLMGATGGYISKTNTSIAQGAAWQVALSNFGSAPGAGHLATALFFQDGAIANEYLYRNAVPGHPELNRMNTTLDMGGNNIAAAGAITASGNITTSADISARNVTATGTVKAGTADVAGETYTGGWFRTRGDTGWYNEKWGGGWYMSDSTWVRSWMNKNVYTGGEMKAGKLTAEGRTEVGEYLQAQRRGHRRGRLLAERARRHYQHRTLVVLPERKVGANRRLHAHEYHCGRDQGLVYVARPGQRHDVLRLCPLRDHLRRPILRGGLQPDLWHQLLVRPDHRDRPGLQLSGALQDPRLDQRHRYLRELAGRHDSRTAVCR